MTGARIVAGVALLLAVVGAAAQQIYRWTDEKGRVHITDTPPPPTAKAIQKKTYRSGAAPSAQPSYELSQAVKDFPVTLYTAPGCAEPCGHAREALNRRGVPFREVEVTDAQMAEEVKRISGGEQVPVLLVGRSVHTGFLQSAYDSLLDAARYPKAGAVPAREPTAPSASAPPKPEAPEAPRRSGPYAPGGALQ
jgi:glutaredoxin